MAGTKGGTPPAQTPPSTATTTGGNGDDNGQQEVLLPGQPGVASSATRVGLIEDPAFEFSPGSLIGSWFHRLENDRIVWDGCVVAEPTPGVYLLQINRLDVGAENVQRLVPMTRLVSDEDGYDWRFYDSKRQMQEAYAAWVATERVRV